MKKFLTNSAVIIGTIVIGAVYALTWGLGVSQLLWLATQVLIVIAIYSTVKDLETKLTDKDMRRLVNWQDLTWSAGVLAATWFFGRFACSTRATAFRGWLCGIVAVALYVGTGLFYLRFYRPSVMGTEAFDEYMRRKFSRRIARAVRRGDQKKVVRYLGIVCRFHCADDRYEMGSDYSKPFDDRHRNYFELKRSKDAADRTAAEMVRPYIEQLATKFSAYDGEDVKALDAADKARA